MRQLYHVGTCPLCNQGRLWLQKNLTTSAIYAHCEECDQGYLSPEDIKIASGGFLTLMEDYETEDPTGEDVENSVWARVVTFVQSSGTGAATPKDPSR